MANFVVNWLSEPVIQVPTPARENNPFWLNTVQFMQQDKLRLRDLKEIYSNNVKWKLTTASDTFFFVFFILPSQGFDPRSLGADSRRISPQDHGAPSEIFTVQLTWREKAREDGLMDWWIDWCKAMVWENSQYTTKLWLLQNIFSSICVVSDSLSWQM